jgi:hypothetical protein
VNTGVYSAEFGRAAGGVINSVTKSGGNTDSWRSLLLRSREQLGRVQPDYQHDQHGEFEYGTSGTTFTTSSVQAEGFAQDLGLYRRAAR